MAIRIAIKTSNTIIYSI